MISGKYVPPAAGLKPPSLWGTRARLEELFGSKGKVQATSRHFSFRYRSPQHFIEVFRTWYGPMNKTFAALDGDDWSGPVNASAPEPVTNREFSKALGRALHRPAVAPVPAFALRILYGEMAKIITTGQRAVPKRALELGYTFRHPDLDEALSAALG